MCVRMHVYTPCMRIWAHDRTHVIIRTVDRGVSPSIMWVLGIEFISSGLLAHIFIS